MCRRLASVHVDQIPRGLKGKIAKAQREKKLHARQARPILQKRHGTQIQYQAQRQQELAFVLLQQQRAAPHDQRHGGQVDKALPARQRHEDGTARQQNNPADFQRQQVIQQNYQR